MKKGILKDSAFGISPLGGNSVEGTGSEFAPIRSESTESVPLVWDERAGAFISELAVDELDDLDDSNDKAKGYEREQAWRAKAGFRKTINP